jgi:hypothetical protein
VSVFDHDGHFLQKISIPAVVNHRSYPCSMTIDEDDVLYVLYENCDHHNANIQSFDANGKFLQQVNINEYDGLNYFVRSQLVGDIAAGADQIRCVMVHQKGARLYDMKGTYRSTIRPDRLDNFQDMAMGSDGLLYVLTNHPRVVVLNKGGEIVRNIPLDCAGQHVAVDEQGQVLVSQPSQNRILIVRK